MTDVLHGAAEKNLRREIAETIEKDPILHDGLDRYDFSRPEHRIVTTKKLFRMAEVMKGKSDQWKLTFYRMMEAYDASVGMRFFVQNALWIGTIKNQGTPEQQELWLDGASEFKIIGCFGMTELGHSSHLRGSETIAVFDEATDEFVINSTAITATKIWIGLAGQIATHCIVFCNLRSKGQECGLQLIIVPLRDPESGKPLPGVHVGDLGAKAGRNGLDNGWIQFHNVRVPRTNMLARFAQVSRDGTFTPSMNPAIAYGSTITERVGAVIGAYEFVSQALVISCRYAAVRRQGPSNPQILDYQSHQYALMPILARCYATMFSFQRINKVYQQMLTCLAADDIAGFMKPIADVHNTSCCLKAFCGWWAADSLEACRRSMGGHAYSQYSGIPRLIGDFGVMTTGGGDNIVLAQQTARYLVKTFERIMAGKSFDQESSVSYLLWAKNSAEKFPEKFQKSLENVDHVTLDVLLEAFRCVAFRGRIQVESSS
eukprot:TRINITY_DN2251_c1_g1_i2.p1 TRINITY_DN2251_c1_g1~~TRINITY_DN2251_c1_g1_i2.p1  ORF type:complete len:515 (+),score=161.51 TRINITY_DN2251_c1_g1_i2:85-1545(+)